MSSVGERIRQLRGKVSRATFSNKYHIHRNTLERWEKGLRTPSEEFLAALAEGERVSFDWVKFGRGQMEIHPDLREENRRRVNVSPATVACDKIDKNRQHIDLYTKKINTTCDVAGRDSDLVQVFRENADLLRQNGDLRVEVERLRMDIERRDARIADLERQLAEVLKEPQGRQALLDQGRAAAG